MKKIFLAVTALMLIFSCSSDDNGSTNPEQEPEPTTLTFIKSVKVNSIGSDGSENIRTIVFEYNEDKKVQKFIYSNNTYEEFEYLNGNVNKWKSYSASGSLQAISSINYQSDGKVAHTLIANDGSEVNSQRVEYSYNTSGQLEKWVNCGVPGGCGSTTMYTSDSLIYTGNNVSKVFEGGFWTGEVSHQYDDKPNPFKNYDANFKRIVFRSFALPVNENNIVKSIRTEPSDETINYVLTYHENGFPKTVVGTRSNGNLYVSYEYEYVEL